VTGEVPEATRMEFRRNWERMLEGLKDLVEHAVVAG
jgi:hypothetical protein